MYIPPFQLCTSGFVAKSQWQLATPFNQLSNAHLMHTDTITNNLRNSKQNYEFWWLWFWNREAGTSSMKRKDQSNKQSQPSYITARLNNCFSLSLLFYYLCFMSWLLLLLQRCSSFHLQFSCIKSFEGHRHHRQRSQNKNLHVNSDRVTFKW